MMKIQTRSKSTTRSMTPKRILCQKPPFPKLIQKKNRVQQVPLNDQNKENQPLDLMLPEDSVLIKPSDTLKSLYTSSPVGDLHICLPYELGQVNKLNSNSIKKEGLSVISSAVKAHNTSSNIKKSAGQIPKVLVFSLKDVKNNCKPEPVPVFDEETSVNLLQTPISSEVDECSIDFSKRNSEKSIKGTETSEDSPVKREIVRKYSKLPPKMIDTRRRRETPKVTRIEISVGSSYETPVNISQGSAYSASAARNNRVKLLSKDFKVTRNTLTNYCKVSSLNSTPEPVEY